MSDELVRKASDIAAVSGQSLEAVMAAIEGHDALNAERALSDSLAEALQREVDGWPLAFDAGTRAAREKTLAVLAAFREARTREDTP